MSARFVVSAVVALAVGATACGPKPPEVRFTSSRAFHAISGRVHGILEADVDGDGVSDAIVATRTRDGYRVEVLRQTRGERGSEWKPLCQGPTLDGEDLDAFRFVDLGDQPAVYAMVLLENPEELRQSFVVLDLRGDCTPLFGDQLQLERGDPERQLTPPGLRGGVMLDGDAAGLTIVDEPDYLHLHGVTGELRVLQSVRSRHVRWVGGKVNVEEHEVPLVGALELKLLRGEAQLAAPRDGEPLLRLGPGDDGHLKLVADRPIVLLEVHHGCGEGSEKLTLSDGKAPPYELGSHPAADGLVSGSGSSSEGGGAFKDLVALSKAEPTLELDLGPQSAERCLRAVKAYGFATLQEAPAAARSVDAPDEL